MAIVPPIKKLVQLITSQEIKIKINEKTVLRESSELQ